MTDLVDTTQATSSFADDWQRWHDAHEAARAHRHGFLAITSINWLTAEPQRFADAPGAWHTDETGVHVTLDDGEEIVVDGAVIRGRHDVGVVPERASINVHWRDAVIEVAKRGGNDIIRPRHPGAPIVTAYRGTPTFEPTERWAVPGRYVPFAEPQPFTVGSVVEGLEHVYQSPGTIEFEIDGARHSLVAFADKPEKGLFVLFADATSGVTTYGANRSLSVPAPAADGSVLVDFNRAVNLPCAYTDLATCPLPPAANRLPIAVEAGEKLPLERT